jgi:hypothetical protein
VRKIRASLFLMLETVTFFAFVALAFGADSNVPAKEQLGWCSPDQFMAWIYTIGTCVSREFKDKIFEPHIKPDMSGGIFLNISGSSELNKVCLRCHIRVKPQLY